MSERMAAGMLMDARGVNGLFHRFLHGGFIEVVPLFDTCAGVG